MSRLLVHWARLALWSLILSFAVSCSSSPGSRDNHPRPDSPSPSVNAYDGFVRLTWAPVANAVKYQIYWSTTPGGTADMSDPIPVTDLSYPHEGRQNGQTYYYAVTALSEYYESEKSAEVAATPRSPPDAPQNVHAVLVGGVATVTWDAMPYSESYTVYMASEPGVGSKTFATLADGEIAKTSGTAFARGGLEESKTYYFTITASNVGGEGAESLVVSAAPTTVAIAAGANHSCAIRPDRTVECWGENTDGQLGLGDNARRYSPQQVGADHNWHHVAAGGSHTCAINTNGTCRKLFCWGQNTYGQLGRSDQTFNPNPTQIGPDEDWQTVSAGTSHTCAIKTDHTLWCWGSNNDGQLGFGEIGSNVNEPKPVILDPVWSTVSAGGNHTCAVRLDGVLQCWGENAYGQLGASTAPNNTGFVQVADTAWTTVAVGDQHSCALKTDTSLWCWGRNMFGQVGTGVSEPFYKTPQRIGTDVGWTSVELGKEHSCATRSNGRVWCWGANLDGQLRIDDLKNRNVPVEVNSGMWWHAAALGDSHTCALATGGTFGCWGRKNAGQLGEGVPKNYPEPVGVSRTGEWRSVVAGWYNTCAIKLDDSLWCWGVHMAETTPVRVGGDQPWMSLALADYSVCAIRTDRSLWCSDFGYYSHLDFKHNTARAGIESDKWRQVVMQRYGGMCALRSDRTIWCAWSGYSTNDRYKSIPLLQLGTEANWESVDFTDELCAIKTDGSFWCLDRTTNDFKRHGNDNDWRAFSSGGGCAIKTDGSTNCISSYTSSESSIWISASRGPGIACGVKSNFSLWCWGSYYYSADASGRVGTDNNWTEVFVGRDHFACGRKIDNTLWCWGKGTYGQLGNRFEIVSKLPVSVQNASTWSAIVAGTHHTCAITRNDVIDANQRLHCWGNNSYGQLGIDSNAPAATPTPVDPTSRWLAVAAGAYHTCGIKPIGMATSGTLWCWGANGDRQLGIDDPDGKRVPAAVDGGSDWTTIATGENHTCALKNNNSLWCWGRNTEGQVGNNSSVAQPVPSQIDPTTAWKAVTAGGNHTCAITIEGALRCWGANDRGQLGIGDDQIRLTPVPVQADTAMLWTTVVAGSKHTCATSNGKLWCWGDNSFGQLAYGNDGTRLSLTPKQSSYFSVSSFALGANHTCANVYPYEVWCAGDNGSGQLGDGTTLPKSSLYRCNFEGIRSLLSPQNVLLAAGGRHTCATRLDGTLSCWGDNTHGQVGSGQ